ncbi:MAG: acyl-CoA synthetase, partial [Myxococcota bacterium]|nr:acyl-CoA synthetase [Myxococcota bacterium]
MEWNIADLVEATADAVPDREALVAGPARRTYAELDARANRVAHHLAAAGVRQGEHVGIHAYNCAEFVETMMGCYKLRAVPININYRYVEEELRYLFDNADLVALVHQRRFTPRIAAIREGLPKLRHFVAIDDESGEDTSPLGSVAYEEALAGASPERDFGPRSPDDRYVLYTGGTTGMPKGVVWRQQDVIFALGGGIDHVTGVPHERPEEMAAKTQNPPACTLATAPLMHGAAQWGTMGGLFVGNKVVLYCERSFDPEAIWDLVEREKVNVMTITGDAMGRPLADDLDQAKARHDLSSLIAVASTAAIFSPSVKAQFKAAFPNLVITDSVGSTEGGFNGTNMYQGEGAPRREGAGINVKPGRGTIVIDEEGKRIPPGDARIGKLARGGNIPIGYYKDPEKTAATFIQVEGERYAVPGDFAKMEDDGTITLLGRGSVCINSGGEKIYPEEVEAARTRHPDVFDAVVLGIPDARWGEREAAVVQPRPGATPALEAL